MPSVSLQAKIIDADSATVVQSTGFGTAFTPKLDDHDEHNADPGTY